MSRPMLKRHEATYISNQGKKNQIRRRYTYTFSDKKDGKLEVSVANFPGRSNEMIDQPDETHGGGPVMNFRRIEWQINY